MQIFSELHINELRKYLELPEGIPPHDAFGDILSRVDMQAVNECFRVFTDQIRETEIQDAVVALDGKTIRRSQRDKRRAFHKESAYLSDMQIVLGHAAVVINSFRKLCMQMLKADTSVKDSLAGKRQRCAWSFDYALSVAVNFALSFP